MLRKNGKRDIFAMNFSETRNEKTIYSTWVVGVDGILCGR